MAGAGGGSNLVAFRHVTDFVPRGRVNHGEGFAADRFHKLIVDKDLKEPKREINVVIKH